ncbi:MAG TPA: hypothetical protein VIF64_08480 [Pyrinomonadaceae bacterium]
MNHSPLARLNRAVVEFTTGRHDPEVNHARSRPPEGYRLLSEFFSPEHTIGLLRLIEARSNLFKPVAAKAGMSLAYNVLDGFNIDQHFPELRELASGPLLKITEETFSVPLELMADPKRAFRIQCYRARHEGFKWHLDGGLYSALLTLVNTNEGATEVLSPEWSRVLFPVPYLLFPFARLLEFAKPKPLIARPGDLLVIKGGEVLHRGVTTKEEGERLVFVATYNPIGTKPTPLWDWFARRLNY